MPNEQAEKACATSDEYSCVLKFLISQRYQVACKSGHEKETLMPRDYMDVL
jgi:hypothetical protein